MVPLLPFLPGDRTIQLLAGSVLILLSLNLYFSYQRVLKSIGYLPGYRSVFSLFSSLNSIFPRIHGVFIGRHWGVLDKYKPFAEAGQDVISSVGLYPFPVANLVVADPVAIKEITANRARFPKPIEDYKILSLFGENILTTDGDEWKKHRKICAPAFGEKNNKLVWEETVGILLGLFDKWGTNTAEIAMDHCVEITLPLALYVISVAGFGRRVSWAEDTQIPPEHKLTFKNALQNVSDSVLIKLLAPSWAYSFSKSLRNVQIAFDELELYMQEMIAARRMSEMKEERHDLFNALLDAFEGDDDGGKLTDRELIGNIFMFLLAGHETTAHTLSFVFGMLALEQQEQEKLHQHITSVLPIGHIPGYEQLNMFTHSMAVYYETLRLFPVSPYVPKVSAEDTRLPVILPDGTKGTIPLPKGMKIMINTTALHYNPRYWPEPELFKPSRFLGDWPKDAFFPFSSGARACIGRGFNETEGIAAITMLVSRYKIELKNPELYEGLTHLEKREKLLASKPGLTVRPIRVPLVFKRR